KGGAHHLRRQKVVESRIDGACIRPHQIRWLTLDGGECGRHHPCGVPFSAKLEGGVKHLEEGWDKSALSEAPSRIPGGTIEQDLHRGHLALAGIELRHRS